MVEAAETTDREQAIENLRQQILQLHSAHGKSAVIEVVRGLIESRDLETGSKRGFFSSPGNPGRG